MTKFNDEIIAYCANDSDPDKLPADRDELLNLIVDAIFRAEEELEKRVSGQMMAMRAAEQWDHLEGAATIAHALGIRFNDNLTYPFPTDEYGRPIVYSRPAGAALDGYALGRNECFSYVNYAVVPSTGKVYIEAAIDNPTFTDTIDTAVVDLDEAEDYALNALYSGFDAVLSHAWDGVDEEDADDLEQEEKEDEETIARLKRDIREEVDAERRRLANG